jgi:hypothetical protein
MKLTCTRRIAVRVLPMGAQGAGVGRGCPILNVHHANICQPNVT